MPSKSTLPVNLTRLSFTATKPHALSAYSPNKTPRHWVNHPNSHSSNTPSMMVNPTLMRPHPCSTSGYFYESSDRWSEMFDIMQDHNTKL
jgi:hypothetical protein